MTIPIATQAAVVPRRSLLIAAFSTIVEWYRKVPPGHSCVQPKD